MRNKLQSHTKGQWFHCAVNNNNNNDTSLFAISATRIWRIVSILITGSSIYFIFKLQINE